MEGGKYLTCFPDDGNRVLRSFLYKLENLGIVKLIREEEKKDLYKYIWELTEKGKKLIEKDENLQMFWEEKKIGDFYQKIINFL